MAKRTNPTTPRAPRPRDYGLFEVLKKGTDIGYVDRPYRNRGAVLASEPHSTYEMYLAAIRAAADLRESTGKAYYVRRLSDHPPAEERIPDE